MPLTGILALRPVPHLPCFAPSGRGWLPDLRGPLISPRVSSVGDVGLRLNGASRLDSHPGSPLSARLLLKPQSVPSPEGSSPPNQHSLKRQTRSAFLAPLLAPEKEAGLPLEQGARDSSEELKGPPEDALHVGGSASGAGTAGPTATRAAGE